MGEPSSLRLGPPPAFDSAEWGHWARMVGRLGPETSVESAQRELASIASNRVDEFPRPDHASLDNGLLVDALQASVTAGARPVRVPGIGVEFERFGGSPDRRAIEAFLHRNEAATLRPESGPLSLGS